jgi:hypothetical protein
VNRLDEAMFRVTNLGLCNKLFTYFQTIKS